MPNPTVVGRVTAQSAAPTEGHSMLQVNWTVSRAVSGLSLDGADVIEVDMSLTDDEIRADLQEKLSIILTGANTESITFVSSDIRGCSVG